MSRVLNRAVMFFYDLHASGNASRAESMRMKARAARPPVGRS